MIAFVAVSSFDCRAAGLSVADPVFADNGFSRPVLIAGRVLCTYTRTSKPISNGIRMANKWKRRSVVPGGMYIPNADVTKVSGRKKMETRVRSFTLSACFE